MQLWSEGQLEVLVASLDQARGGRPTMLVIEGEAGTGKTALLDELVGRAHDFGVLAGDGLENLAVPFNLLAQWGVDWRESRSGTDSAPFVAAQALALLLDELASVRPVLLRLDDLHWADPESVEAMVWMLRRLSGDRLLVAVGTRPLPPDQHTGWQRWAAGRHHSSWIVLTGLPLAEGLVLIRRHRPQIESETAERLWHHTSGNPLYLTALLQEYDAGELGRMRMLPAPSAFAQVLNARVARLPEPSVTMLRAASVLGTGRIPLPDLTQVGQASDPAGAVQPLVDSGLVSAESLDGSPSLRISHALVRAAVYHQTPLPQRRLLHSRAADVVVAEGAALEHRMAAAAEYDEQLAESMEGFALRLYRQRSYRLAAQYQEWASVLTREPRRRERRWLESMFYHVLMMDLEPVREVIEGIRRAADPALSALVLGTWAVWERRRRDGIELLEPIANLALDAVDPVSRYRIEVVLAWARIGAGHPTPLIAAGLDRAKRMEVVDPGLAGVDLVCSGMIQLRVRGAAHVLEELEGLPELAAAVPLLATDQLAWRGTVRARLGLLPEAVDDLVESTRRIQDGVTDLGVGSFHAILGYVQWLTGDWSRARLSFRLSWDLSRPETHPMTLALASLVNIGEGRFPEADQVLERAQATMAAAPWLEACEELLSTRIIRLHAQGSAADRAHFLPQLRGTALFPQQRVGSNPVLTLNLALAALWCHDTAYAEQCIEELSATTPQAPWVPAVELWLRGLLAEARGRASTALTCLSSAVEHDSGELPLYRAHLLADHARVAGQLGHRGMALRSRERSADGYRSLGARPYLDHLSEGAVAPKSNRLPPVTPLTDREKDVLTLVLTGLSYAQIARNLFITQSTVGYHLSNIYAKTGVSSRHRLTELVRSQPQAFGLGLDRPVDQLI